MNESQRIALVTGANRGIGLEIVRQLAEIGIHTILTSRDPQRGEAATAALASRGLPVSYLTLEVSDPVSVQAARTQVEAQFGRLHILVNNAGVRFPEDQSVMDLPLATLQETFAVNTFGALLMCQAFVPLMRAQGDGRIVNVSSQMGQLTTMSGKAAAYRMSKAAMNALTRTLAAELAGTGVLVNCMHPGWVHTEMGGPKAPLTPAEGADTAVWLATLPPDGPSGGFFVKRRQVDW